MECNYFTYARRCVSHTSQGTPPLAHIMCMCFCVRVCVWLSNQMDSKIAQFIAVTGGSEEDARGLLEACAGDLDMAVNMHLESKGGGVSGPYQRRSDDTTEKSYEDL